MSPLQSGKHPHGDEPQQQFDHYMDDEDNRKQVIATSTNSTKALV
jgi:hypothetical protein